MTLTLFDFPLNNRKIISIAKLLMCISLVLGKGMWLATGYQVDKMNQCQGHQGHSQVQNHLANSLICMGLLYNAPS